MAAVRPSISAPSLPPSPSSSLPPSLPLPNPRAQGRRYSGPPIGKKRTLSPSLSSPPLPPSLALPLPSTSPLLRLPHPSLSAPVVKNDTASSSRKKFITLLPPSIEVIPRPTSSCFLIPAVDSVVSSIKVAVADFISSNVPLPNETLQECSLGIGIEGSREQPKEFNLVDKVENDSRETLLSPQGVVIKCSDDIISCWDNEIRRRKYGRVEVISDPTFTSTSTSTYFPSSLSITGSTATAEQGQEEEKEGEEEGNRNAHDHRASLTPNQCEEEDERKRKLAANTVRRKRLNAAQHFKKRGSMSPLQRCCDILCLVWPVVLVLSVTKYSSSSSSNNSSRHAVDENNVPDIGGTGGHVKSASGGGNTGERAQGQGHGQGQGQGQGNVPPTQSTQNYSYSYSATSSYAVSSSYSAVPSSSSPPYNATKSSSLPSTSSSSSSSIPASTVLSSHQHQYQYRVSDGWWWCNAVLDPELQRLVDKVS